MSSAQIAAQVVTAPYHSQTTTTLAPEPRDIIWSNMNHSPNAIKVRQFLSFAMMFLLLFFWIFPIGSLATFLSYKEIQRVLPWLARLIDQNDRLRAIVQHTLPTLGVVLLNALLPMILEYLAYFEGIRARSWIEFSIMRRYFLFLLVNVVFIFLFVSSYWQVARDLYESPGRIPEKLATALNKGTAKNYFVCYVILQGLGLIPLQLLNLGVIIPRLVYRLFITRTPRDFAELNAPPMINYGAVYPQCILIFIITLLYGIIQPLILIFGTIFFGMAYVVYKYKLLFVFYKPYESNGHAWPITFIRLMWGIVIFQVFMAGIFLLSELLVFAAIVGPLIVFTLWWGWYTHSAFQPLSSYVSLSSTTEVQRGAETEEVTRLREGHPVTWSQSNLNRRRYAENDDTLYVAPEDERTDYSQPPMSNWYSGVLNTGKRRYGHPALTGVLPRPWLPLKKGQTLVNRANRKEGPQENADSALVLTLRRRSSAVRKRSHGNLQHRTQSMPATGSGPADSDLAINPWSSSTALLPQSSTTQNNAPENPPAPMQHLQHRLSYDAASGIMTLPENGDWLVDASEAESDDEYGTSESLNGDQSVGVPSKAHLSPSDQPTPPNPRKRHATYFHHPEKRASIRQGMPGEFPR